MSSMIREIYRPQIRRLVGEKEYDKLVEQHGEDKIWEVLGEIGREQMRRETGLPL